MFLVSKPSAQLIDRFISEQKDLPFSYGEVGATRGQLPPGYTHDHNRVELGRGREVFERAVTAVRQWKQFDLGWVRIVPENVPVEVGSTVAVCAKSFGVWSLSAARVVYVINENADVNRFGFAYGTLPDHVERGEERFLIEWNRVDDTVSYDILAFSSPRHPLIRLTSPVARVLQKRFARDSLRVMRAECGD
jgi:uncharacterized protein (UPF0548 family)